MASVRQRVGELGGVIQPSVAAVSKTASLILTRLDFDGRAILGGRFQ